MDNRSLDTRVPIGFSDLFMDEAARQSWFTDRLRALFSQWGYTPVIPPTVAFAENLAVELGPQIAQDLYRFFDRQGNTLALRADLTVPVARIVGTKLYDQPLPLRLYYVERVFRHVSPQMGQRRELTQAGVELVGVDTPQADAEVIALAAQALDRIGITDYRLAVGQMGFFRALVNALYLSPQEVSTLEQTIDRRNEAALRRVLDNMDLPASIHALLSALPSLSGDRRVIERARELLPVEVASVELDRLDTVLDLLDAYGLSDKIVVDLGEVRGMEYYTGLVFRGYAAGVGAPLCSGGRYDDLVGHFGPDLPAVGFGISLDLARMAVTPEVEIGPEIIVQGCMHADCLHAVDQLRQCGRRVIVDTLDRDDQELIDYARGREARAICCRASGGWALLSLDGYELTGSPSDIVEALTQP